MGSYWVSEHICSFEVYRLASGLWTEFAKCVMFPVWAMLHRVLLAGSTAYGQNPA